MDYKNILRDDTVALCEEENSVLILDQTQLPSKEVILSLKTPEAICDAIKKLKVRGAPAIGVTAALGVYVCAKTFMQYSSDVFMAKMEEVFSDFAATRPTAVNLFWALDEMRNVMTNNQNQPRELLIDLLRQKAINIRNQDIEMCMSIGKHGHVLFRDGQGILTHCNAGSLAATRYGTALAPIYYGAEQGKNFHVYADETRPLLQGARLTAYELQKHGIAVSLICDNMASWVMKNQLVQAVIVGADRIVANGDVCNKIGTSAVAILANYYKIPFYVAAPTSTIDMSLPTGDSIPIEERAPEEITEMWYQERMAPLGISTCNPAFDVTPAQLISGIITEKGILYPNYKDSLKNIFEN